MPKRMGSRPSSPLLPLDPRRLRGDELPAAGAADIDPHHPEIAADLLPVANDSGRVAGDDERDVAEHPNLALDGDERREVELARPQLAKLVLPGPDDALRSDQRIIYGIDSAERRGVAGRVRASSVFNTSSARDEAGFADAGTETAAQMAISAAAVPRMAPLLVEEGAHLPRPRRMLELAQRLGLDLPDALARHAELLPDFLQRVIGVHADAESHSEHALFAGG